MDFYFPSLLFVYSFDHALFHDIHLRIGCMSNLCLCFWIISFGLCSDMLEIGEEFSRFSEKDFGRRMLWEEKKCVEGDNWTIRLEGDGRL